MVTDTTAGLYDSAAHMYLGWVDGALRANERLAHVARIWIDESLGVQQDLAEAARRAFADAQDTLMRDGDVPNPLLLASRTGELLRGGYAIWNEAGLKAQERLTRVAETAFAELRTVQTDLTDTAQERMSQITRSFNGTVKAATA